MRLNLAVLCLVLAAGLSCATGYGRGYIGLLTLITVFLVLGVLPERGRKTFWRALIVASVGAAALAAVQLPWLDRVTGPFGSPNYLGAFAAVMVFIAWRERHKLAIGANFAAVILAQSRGALLAVGAGACVLLWRRHRYLAIATAAIAPVGVVLIQRPVGTDARLEVWRLGLQVFSQRPLTGWGIGGISPATVIDQRLMTLDHFYSVPLDWLVATGVLGLAAGAWLMAETWRSGLTEDRAILAAWIVAGLFLSASWPMWLVLFALLADLVGRDVPHRGAVNEHKPFLNSSVRALRPE